MTHPRSLSTITARQKARNRIAGIDVDTTDLDPMREGKGSANNTGTSTINESNQITFRSTHHSPTETIP
ncbi:hypothetical protein PAAG_08363 [Paracoccidioides lutzii Pb01]|uniref:Uncharacterized protein n=1 Tax=Paracoccidioides lutzii (strain ATCC MYA-826 / Pb01) TaxID=502779 RepID=C1HC72_PARBA|nr:hypothetical protein PAAG_08363 [Paracoccidioides lutzii Pb01]EEH38636.2 hypothetical protein PAAG_08363 [Paracoccidioides lutzii Pb01]